jgi:hypothetical protein
MICGAGVPPAVFYSHAETQNRRRDAGATKLAEHCGLAAGSCNMARPECKIG